MMDVLIAFGFFLLKVIVIVVAILIVVAMTKGVKAQSKIKIKHVNKHYEAQDVYFLNEIISRKILLAFLYIQEL